MKRWFQTGLLLLLVLCLIPSAAVPGGAAVGTQPVQAAGEKRRYVALGGDPFGIKLYTEGVLVIGVDAVDTAAGPVTPGEAAGVKKGDVILSVNGVPIEDTQSLIAAVSGSGGKALELTVQRNGEPLHLSLLPARTANGAYRAGLWVRDSAAGIGTVTFYDSTRRVFAGLGHGVCDADTGSTMPLSSGEAVIAQVEGFYKSSAGDPGELCGVFTDAVLGPLLYNGENGVYGTLLTAPHGSMAAVARRAEVRPGKAQMITTIDAAGPRAYDIEITKVFPADAATRNLVVQVTDPALLEKTGGILQGMSGSPIVQNAMLVGALTHVFVNDPTQGYAIFAQTMLETADRLAAENKAAA
ncbi:MAG: SpoIVB peptidase [Clostridia bacterium]|nr:SpoIVB peptidase [Clostridia bacterium]